MLRIESGIFDHRLELFSSCLHSLLEGLENSVMNERVDLDLTVPGLIAKLELKFDSFVQSQVVVSDWIVNLLVQETEEREHLPVVPDNQV